MIEGGAFGRRDAEGLDSCTHEVEVLLKEHSLEDAKSGGGCGWLWRGPPWEKLPCAISYLDNTLALKMCRP